METIEQLFIQADTWTDPVKNTRHAILISPEMEKHDQREMWLSRFRWYVVNRVPSSELNEWARIVDHEGDHSKKDKRCGVFCVHYDPILRKVVAMSYVPVGERTPEELIAIASGTNEPSDVDRWVINQARLSTPGNSRA